MLISIIAVLVSAGVFGIQLLMIYSSGSRNNFLNFLIALTGGVRMLLIGVILIALVLFALAFIYFWNNGYYFIVTRILRRNEKIGIPIEFTKLKKTLDVDSLFSLSQFSFQLFMELHGQLVTFSKQMENFQIFSMHH